MEEWALPDSRVHAEVLRLCARAALSLRHSLLFFCFCAFYNSNEKRVDTKALAYREYKKKCATEKMRRPIIKEAFRCSLPHRS